MARFRERLIALFGGPWCQECGTPDSESRLEFAHTAATEIKGRGRGAYQRLRDVERNRGAYRLLCRACHVGLDFEGRDPWTPRDAEVPF